MDDFLTKKRDSGPILDLSKVSANTKEEFRKLFDRVPDFKIKAEKLRPDDVKVRDNLKKMKFKTGKKDFKAMREPFLFSDPIPPEMRTLKIKELAAVPIDWKMLTTVRPKSKIDEEYFSRLIDLRKMEMKTESRDKRAYAMDPQIRKIKNKAGVVELRIVNCIECGEDFCIGTGCRQNSYDCFTRVPVVPTKVEKKIISLDVGDINKKKKSKPKKERKSRSKSPTKSKQPKKRTKSKSPKKSKNKGTS